MTTHVPAVFWIVTLLVFGVTPVPAAAQPATGATQVGAGYQLLRLPDSTSQLGFNIDVSRSFSGPWYGVGEVGLAHFDAEGDDTGSADISHFAGGVRFERPFTDRLSGFAQAVLGLERSSGEFDTDWAFMLQPGVGIFASIGPRWGLVVQADARPVFFEEEVDEQFRFVLGARFALR